MAEEKNKENKTDQPARPPAMHSKTLRAGNASASVAGEKEKSSSESASVKPAPKEAKLVKQDRKRPQNRRFNRNKRGREPEEFEQRIIDIARVTRVMAGGKRMRFRACVAIGNKKGQVAIGLAKGADVTVGVTKAVTQAKKNLTTVSIVNDTIPHEILQKYGAAKILFKPARRGRGIIAGGAVRVVLELSGIKNITSKILGTNNKVNNVKCTIEALKNLKRVEHKKKKEKKEDKKDEKKK